MLLVCAERSETIMTLRLVTENGKLVAGVDLAQFLAPEVASNAPPVEAQVKEAVAPKENLPPPWLMSIKEARRELRLGKTKIFDLINTGVLERVRIGRRSLLTSESVLALAGKK